MTRKSHAFMVTTMLLQSWLGQQRVQCCCMDYLEPVKYSVIACLQSCDSDDAQNAAGGQEVIFLYRNR